MTIESDFLVIGGGIIGLSIARELRKSFHGSKVVLIEKEDHCGEHASGRNSGVLHAGFYYTADSLKARFTRDGTWYSPNIANPVALQSTSAANWWWPRTKAS